MNNANPAANDAAYPPELADFEDELVKQRRIAAGLPQDGPKIGFALSGGGIRSATFCLGVFQALAKAKTDNPGGLLGRIDFLSTVSGGGYFGSFLGRLFAREHIQGPADVAKVLTGDEQPAKGQTTFRFLRDNGRYLAPRGSGDLLALITVTVRNWLAVQTVLAIAVLALFVLLQYADMRLAPAYPALCSFMPLCGVAVGPPPTSIVVSPWFMWLAPVFALWVLPTAWAYWVIGVPLSTRQAFRRTDVVVLVLLAVAWKIQWIPPMNPNGTWPPATIAAAVTSAIAFAATLWSLLVNPYAMFDWLLSALHIGSVERQVADASRSRNRLTRSLKTALVVVAIIGVVGAIDSLGATAYALALAQHGFWVLAGPIASVLGAFGGVAAFGRQLLVFLGGEGRGKAVRLPLSVVSWAVAVLVLGSWLVALNAVSHAVAWQGFKPYYADALFSPPATKIADADTVVLANDVGGQPTLRALEPPNEPSRYPTAAAPEPRFAGRVLVMLLILVATVGSVRTLLNASSLHSFYAHRLTRAYLGASNRKRLDDDSAHITEVIDGDDLPSDRYWNWPRLPHEPGGIEKVRAFFVRRVHNVRSMFTNVPMAARESPQSPARTQAAKGAPLHFVNVTINETLDGRTGVQMQDRKGVPLAVGPGGLSVGVRHHLIADEHIGFVARPAGDGHAVFALERLRDEPEVMTLGRWVSLSGAAFSSALGARTTVPLALLATFANVRLGYWWDSGLGKGWTGPLLPVYRGLLSELIARLRGTGIRLWNLTDGGHFENLGGYELIRRKLPVIVLIDAEADPDFEFPGLSELMRKARLDFGAEIHFLDEQELKEETVVTNPPVFTSLERLRRGKWNEDGSYAALSAEGDRRDYSRAHAALATVTYRDGSVGRIVYVKASLTGREPADVLQYHAAHPDFPHETTSDQFFDEAQWESYRRLGEYVGTMVLRGKVLA